MLEIQLNPPLGVASQGIETTQIALVPGEWLVLYTDGVVERRDQAIDDSLMAFVDHLGMVDPDPASLLAASLAFAQGADDDATVVVLGLAMD